MWARNGFVCWEHAVEDAGAPVWKVRGADASMIAFLPRSLPRCDVAELDQIGTLLAQASDPPPASFAGPDALVATLRARDHRGAIAIIEPVLYIDRDERIARVELRVLGQRVGVGFGASVATDRRRVQIVVEERLVRIDHWQRFWLGCAEDFDGRFAEAEHAALGWLRITYTLHVDGAAQAWCSSSFLPSVWCYRDHVRVHRREMAEATRAESLAVLRPKPQSASGTVWAGLDVSTGCVNAVA